MASHGLTTYLNIWIQSNLHVCSPLVRDHFSARYKRPQIQNTKNFPVKIVQSEPLVNDHISQETATAFWDMVLSFSIVFNLL